MPFVRGVVVAVLVALVTATGLSPTPVGAGMRPRTLSDQSPKVTWRGTLDRAAPLGCGEVNLGCDTVPLTVDAPKGAWVSVSAGQGHNVRVTRNGRLVGDGGMTVLLGRDASTNATTTFRHMAAGRAVYRVSIDNIAGSPATAFPYKATATLTGRAWDRVGECGPRSGVERALDDGTAPTRELRVRLVGAPKDAAAVRRAGRTLVEIYGRIGVPVSVSYDFMRIKDEAPVHPYPYEQVRRHYGGERPAGVDVVHVMTDLFPGGFAACGGGIAYPEKAFSVSNVRYTVQGTVPVDAVPAGMIAAHEIGHLLGADHHQFNCAEAVPQQMQRPSSDGWTAPCTIMSPAALLASETFSTLERNTIRSFVNVYAGS